MDTIKNDRFARDSFIEESIPFILRCASLSAKRFITRQDDVFAIGLEAFNNAINTFTPEKGDFNCYAGTCIKNAVNDYYRKQKKHSNTLKFSELAEADECGETAFEIADIKLGVTDTAVEILSLKEELSAFGISFSDLPKASPPTKKTKKHCMQIAKYIAENDNLIKKLYRKKSLPLKEITEKLKINKKVPERYRRYIITGVIILKGDYEILTGYFLSNKEV